MSTAAAAGTKRKQKTHVPSDFKRRKAKVGKRAIAPANETNVKFKAVAVGVRSQSVLTDTTTSISGSITSSKGKSLTDLMLQFSHPAVPVRISACRGLLDVVSHQDVSLESHLSTLLPLLFKCAANDEDDSVRPLGWSCIKAILTKCSKMHGNLIMKPFLPLMIAFLTCGLYSLDKNVRFDASQGVEIVCHIVGNRMDRDMIFKIMPSYITLLTDFGPKTDSHNTEDNKKSTSLQGGKRFQVLMSLLSLCKAMKQPTNCRDHTNNDDDVLQTSKHPAVILTAPEYHHAVQPLSTNLLSLTTSNTDKTSATTASTTQPTTTFAIDQMPTDLLNKLRDIYVEVIQRGTPLDAGGMDLPIQDAEEVALLIAILGRLHGFLSGLVQPEHFTPILNILLPAFPFYATSKEHASRYETLNGDICELVLQLSSKQDAILDYLLTSPPSATVVKVLGTLLIRSDDEDASKSRVNRDLIFNRLQTEFFDDVTPELARSMAGRRAANILYDTLNKCNFDMETIDSLSKMLIKLPLYLKAWQGDHVYECRIAISTLHGVVRRLNVHDEKCQSLVQALRKDLAPIFTSTKKSLSILEAYPQALQRKAIALIVMLQAPNEETMTGLSYSCTRFSTGIADYTLDVMYMVRRSVSMQVYLNFVITSLGMPNRRKGSTSKTIDHNSLLAHDAAISRVSRALIRCGTSQVLPSVWPVIRTWLELFTTTSENDLGVRLVYMRAALNMLTHFSLDLATMSSSLINTLPEVQVALTNAVIQLIHFCPVGASTERELLHDSFPSLMKPLISLLIRESSILLSIFEQAKEGILAMDAATMEALLSIVCETRLAETLRKFAQTMTSTCHDIKVGLVGGPLERQGEKLWTSLELVVGRIQTH